MSEVILSWKRTQDYLKNLISINNTEYWQKELDFMVENLSDLIIPLDLKLIGGLDISFDKDNKDLACVCIAVVDAKNNKLVAKHSKIVIMTEPYIVNYLAFRECEHMVACVKEFLELHPNHRPQVLIIDGNGTFHSNRFGSACQLGVRLQQEGLVLPTIGVAKNYLQLAGMPTRADMYASLMAKVDDGREVLHEVLDSETGEWLCMVRKQAKSRRDFNREELGKLSYISPGHQISAMTAVNVVRLCSRCRMPEPVLLADHYAKDVLIKLRTTGDQ